MPWKLEKNHGNFSSPGIQPVPVPGSSCSCNGDNSAAELQWCFRIKAGALLSAGRAGLPGSLPYGSGMRRVRGPDRPVPYRRHRTGYSERSWYESRAIILQEKKGFVSKKTRLLLLYRTPRHHSPLRRGPRPFRTVRIQIRSLQTLVLSPPVSPCEKSVCISRPGHWISPVRRDRSPREEDNYDTLWKTVERQRI
jgi:hypothetical protein